MRLRKGTLLRLLLIVSIFPLGYFAITDNWLQLRHIRVTGNSRLTAEQVIDLSALDEPAGIWAIAARRDIIRDALESNSLIEHAEVSLEGPCALAMRISERKPIAAIDFNNHKLVFDRTGELLEVLGPSDIYLGRTVRGVPPGLLRDKGTPIYYSSEAWSPAYPAEQGTSYPEMCRDLETQFNKLVSLLNYLSANAGDYDALFEYAGMDTTGHVSVKYENLPPILLGRLENSDLQFRCLMGILQKPEVANPREVLDIDLSNIQFPCLHKAPQYYTSAEQKAIIAGQAQPATSNVADRPAVSEMPKSAGDNDIAPRPDMSIFSLNGEDKTDD